MSSSLLEEEESTIRKNICCLRRWKRIRGKVSRLLGISASKRHCRVYAAVESRASHEHSFATSVASWLVKGHYRALSKSTAMRDVIYFMNLIDEMKNFGIHLPGVPKPITTCRVFEDNVGALELANTPKLRPRTKHLAIQLHHFRQYILDKTITVDKVDTHQFSES